MNIEGIKAAAVRIGSRSLLQAKKYSPEVLVGAGVVGIVATVVLASRATLKLEETLDKAENRIETVKDIHAEEMNTVNYRKDLYYAYTLNVLDVAKLYLPSVGVGLGSLACILTAHGMLRRREAAAIAAYNLVERSFSNYRERVKAELGEEKEEEIRRGFIQETIDDPKKEGKTKEVTRVDTAQVYSPYARCFEKGATPNWSPEPSYNLAWIRAQEEYANQMLVARGHVFLNDVYDGLGFPRTREGSVVGWVINDADGPGDNVIDFGIYDLEKKQIRQFLNGFENAVWLDFNVDGIIYDKI